ALRGGRVDLIAIAASGKDEAPDLSVIETDIIIDRHYFACDTSLTVTCHKDLPGHTVALVKGSAHLDVDTDQEGINFIEVASRLEALKLLESREADVYIAYSALTALYLIQKNRFQHIKQVGVPVESIPLSLVVRKDNPDFLKELSLAFGKVLNREDYKLISQKWLGKGIHFTIWERYIKAILITLGLGAGGLFLLVFWNLVLKRKVHRITHDLLISEKKYRDLIDFSPDMIYLVSPGGNINLANKIALSSLGIGEDKLPSLKLHDLACSDDHNEVDAFLECAFREGYAQDEFIFTNGTRNSINVEITAAVVSGTEGSGPMAACVARDITRRRSLEEKLIQSERLVTMGQMAAALAHEINNPLGIILANAQDSLYGGIDSAELQGNLQIIERNSLRAGSIIENLLSFTRPTPFRRAPMDLSRVVDESLFMLKQHLKSKEIKIKQEILDSPLILQGDQNQVQQLLINLIFNSIEAIEQKGTINIRAGQDGGGESPKFLLEVEDTGAGNPEKELPKIFDPFFKKKKKKGFGLGLFIAKTIVERHNGTIIAFTKLGEGTLMKIELPI
ncbi:MAG: transporter substrate-binding domain-containing protein, partial [Deltaproteobacteria bacterium]|nr:transporter substrate-binding domain-containing protein [Deltaproteobacteria bacterium]